MKTFKKILLWFFEDFAIYLYELAEMKFTLHNAEPIRTRRKTSYIPYIVVKSDNIYPQVFFGGRNYTLKQSLGDNKSVYVLPHLINHDLRTSKPLFQDPTTAGVMGNVLPTNPIPNHSTNLNVFETIREGAKSFFESFSNTNPSNVKPKK